MNWGVGGSGRERCYLNMVIAGYIYRRPLLEDLYRVGSDFGVCLISAPSVHFKM